MKRVLLFLGIMFSSMTVFASENVLQSIEIEPVKDTYNIVLVSDKAVDVKKTIQASNKITLTMKDIRASRTLNTIYNNVSNVDTVMVEPQGNGLSIYFQADNAAASSVSFDSLIVSSSVKKSSQNIKLNNPIESYAPIYNDVFEDVKTSSLFDKLKASSAVASIKDTVEINKKNNTSNKFITFGAICLLAASALKLFKRKEPDMKIGLSRSMSERESSMYKGIQSVPQSYMSLERPYTTVNYGLNAYQRENKNPYEEQVQFHNSRLKNYATQTAVQEPVMKSSARSAAVNTVSQPQVKKMTTPVNTAPVNQSNPNIDNLKFLESMTAIYEKSGRHDLARGLKASLSKNNLK